MASSSPVGRLLRQWRTTRRMSQLELAMQAEVSARHISFLENGKSRPSREMVLVLASALEVPLRERNALLSAAGFAPVYRATDLEAPEMAPARHVIDLLLRAHEPFGAVAVDRHWQLLRSNAPATAMTAGLVNDPAALLAAGPPNLLELLFHPAGLRHRIVNWEVVARATAGRVHRELAAQPDDGLRELLDRVLAHPGVPRDFRVLDLAEDPPLLYPIVLDGPTGQLRLITTVTTLGTAQDLTLQELRIESFLPADEETEARLRAMAS